MDLDGWSVDRMPDLTGRVALVTGANSGIGLATSVELAARGAEVVLACRDASKAAAAVTRCELRARGAGPRAVEVDLSDLASVRQGAVQLTGSLEHLDILVNNAGVMGLPRLLSVDGFEMQFATNHLGHFALTGLLAPLLRAAPRSRVVSVSSLLAARASSVPFDDLQGEVAYDGWAAYHYSKLANLLFANELARRSARGDWGITSVAAHPGLSNTSLVANSVAAWGAPRARLGLRLGTKIVGQSSSRGALALLRAATDPEATGGDYYGPRGPGHLRGRPERVGQPRAALDLAMADRLWSVSEELTGAAFPS